MFRTKIEDSILEVCENCSKHGELIETGLVKTVKIKTTIPKVEKETVVIDNYGKKIIEAREKINLTRDKFAKKINEKESVIKRVESEDMIPDDKLIEKIENFLEIKLTVPYEEKKIAGKPVKGKLTIGDVVEVE